MFSNTRINNEINLRRVPLGFETENDLCNIMDIKKVFKDLKSKIEQDFYLSKERRGRVRFERYQMSEM